MARLVTKFKYLKPGARTGVGGYAKYIATREGVDPINDTQGLADATVKQKQMIQKLLKDFPESRELLEYDDYLSQPNMRNASEFLSCALEENAASILDQKTYADYIALRPRAERLGTHGLFSDAGVPVQLDQVSKEMNAYTGNVWTAILSLRREDAERLGYNSGRSWRELLQTKNHELAMQFHIPISHLKWYAAFHNEGHHPHVHMIVYSSDPSEGYLSQQGIAALRASLGREIFSQDLISVYQKQTEARDDIRLRSRELAEEIVEKINEGEVTDPVLEQMLRELAERLSRTKGQKVYGYLKAEVKDLVDAVVRRLSEDPRIASLYDLWYTQKEETIKVYTDELPERVPLSENREFKSVRNAVIQEAMKIVLGITQVGAEQDDHTDDAPPVKQTAEQSVSARPIVGESSAPLAAPTVDVSGSVIRLLYHTSKLIQQRMQDERGRQVRIDRKQQRTINEKKQAQGLKQ